MKRFHLGQSPSGTILQSGIPKGDPTDSPMRMHGRTFTGVVVAVYAYDAPEASNNLDVSAETNAIYADVLCYGKFEGVIPRVLVTRGRQGLHEGEISLPRPAMMAVNGTLDGQTTNPAMMDGDHVVVAFLDDDMKRPYIREYLPHPSADIGNAALPVGQRMRLAGADGSPLFWKHRGAYWGLDTNGNWHFDLTRAHTGQYNADGSEPDPALDGTSGNTEALLPKMARIHIKLGDDREITIEENGPSLVVTLPAGAVAFTSDSFNADASGEVKLGRGAGVEKVVLGTRWNTNRVTRNNAEAAAWDADAQLWAAWTAAMSTLSSALAGMSVGPVAPLAAALTAFFQAVAPGVGAASSAAAASKTAIQTFEAATYLAAQVSVKE